MACPPVAAISEACPRAYCLPVGRHQPLLSVGSRRTASEAGEQPTVASEVVVGIMVAVVRRRRLTASRLAGRRWGPDVVSSTVTEQSRSAARVQRMRTLGPNSTGNICFGPTNFRLVWSLELQDAAIAGLIALVGALDLFPQILHNKLLPLLDAATECCRWQKLKNPIQTAKNSFDTEVIEKVQP